MKASEFRKMVREIINQELEELTTTSSAPALATKFAFKKKKIENLHEIGTTGLASCPPSKLAYDSSRAMRRALAEDKGKYTIIWDDADDSDEVGQRIISENRYLALKRDETHTPRQKIGIAISEVNKRLMEIEDILRFHSRLKTETGLQSNDYWARTHKALIRIESHMTKLSNRIKSMRS